MCVRFVPQPSDLHPVDVVRDVAKLLKSLVVVPGRDDLSREAQVHTALCSGVLCFAVLCRAVLRCVVLCCAVLRGVALCCAVLRCVALRFASVAICFLSTHT